MTRVWELHEGGSAVIAVAVHAGHDVSPPFAATLAVPESDRLREEDPFTGAWADLAPTRIVVHRSRFEVDLNRPRECSVYRHPEDAWGLELWGSPLGDDLVAASQRHHDAFYAMLRRVLSAAARSHGGFLLYDLHSYNHRRAGAAAPPADPAQNPEVNLGTGSMDAARWGVVADRFIRDLRQEVVLGQPLDVRENVRFTGGYLAQWVHANFPGTGCALGIDVKKTFMDEHTGVLDVTHHAAIGAALRATVPGALQAAGLGPRL